jgi:hypothetical protein
MADISQYSIVTYERRPEYWRGAITPIRRPSTFIQGKTISSIVTPDDFESESDAKFAYCRVWIEALRRLASCHAVVTGHERKAKHSITSAIVLILCTL